MAAQQQLEKVSVIPQEEPRAVAVMTPMDMIQRAVESGADIEMLEKLMALQERYEASQSRKEFDYAIAKAKAEIPAIIRNATGHNAKKYADFAAIAAAVDPIISKYGVQYRFRTVQTEKAITVTCVLFGHGHSEETTLTGPADTTGNKNAIQAIGSTLTYLQRYSLVQALGLAASNDDDGKGSGRKTETITQEQADTLRDLLEVNNKDRSQFLKWAKIESVEDLPADKYLASVDAISRKPTK